MLEFLGNLLSGEGNFQNVATIIFVYLLLLWLAFCAWVYSDAIKRYDNMFLAIVWFVAVLILNFPALIFYFIVRPDKEDENILLIRDSGGATATSTEGGINVPLVNFVGENGVAISFQLKINKSALQEEEISNMKIDVGFDDKQLIQTEKVDTQEVPILEKLQNEPSEVIQTEESAGNSFIKYVDARNAIMVKQFKYFLKKGIADL